MLQAKTADGARWQEAEAGRTLREYENRQEMLDDIWEAYQYGWLPVSMTTSKRPKDGSSAPWKWFSKQEIYVVAYHYVQSN